MKEHSAEKENTIAEEESKAPEDAINEEASDDVDDNLTEQDEMERGWDAFMEKSIRPGEDDDGECLCGLRFIFEYIAIFSLSCII